MQPSYNLSPDLRLLLHKTAETLGVEVILHRQNDAPRYGILVDEYTYGSGKNVIVFPSSVLGMLKDYIIAENCYRLLFNGMGTKAGRFKVLSFSKRHAAIALQQIYLDILKDEKTRNMDLWRKKKLLFYLYILFLETLSEIPWTLLSNLLISVHFPIMRNAQVYFLLKESMRDMHELVTVKDFLPQRYFVMHNADPATLAVAYDCGVSMINRWIGMMGMEEWYYWTDPADRQVAFSNQEGIEADAIREIFAE